MSQYSFGAENLTRRVLRIPKPAFRSTETSLNTCIESPINVDSKRSPGASMVWALILGRSDEATAARLRGNGIKCIATHSNCGVAVLAAEKVLGQSVSVNDADVFAQEVTREFARKNGFGYSHICSGNACETHDTSAIHIIRPGVNARPLSGFRIDAMTQDPVHALRIARAVAAQRGTPHPTTHIHARCPKDAHTMKARLGDQQAKIIMARHQGE